MLNPRSRRTMSYRAVHGFSLVEMIVVVAILAITAGIALPSYQNFALGSKLGSMANLMVSSAHLARSEAIKRNTAVTLCVSSNGTSCGSGGWEQGWVVLAGTTVIQRQQALSAGFKGNSSQDTHSFPPSGVGTATTTVTFCRATPEAGGTERVLTISATGRPEVSKTNNGSCS